MDYTLMIYYISYDYISYERYSSSMYQKSLEKNSDRIVLQEWAHEIAASVDAGKKSVSHSSSPASK